MYGGFVLAGGRSRRMGSDKALLRLPDGPTLLERQMALLHEAGAASVTVLGSRGNYGHFGFSVIEDEVPDRGPLGGIHAALRASPFERNLFVPVDLPALTAAFLRELLASDADCAIAAGQPLCAVYSKSCLPIVEAALRSGSLRVTELAKALHAREVSPADPTILANVNTMDDWTRTITKTRPDSI